MDAAQICTAWTTAIASFNDGDYSGLEQLLAPECVFEFVGRSSHEIIDALKRDRDAGWLRHDILSVNAVGSVMTSTARNTFADGSAHHVGGVVRFDENGKVFYVVAADERVPAPTAA